MDELKRQMANAKIKSSSVEHLKDADGEPLQCDQCKQALKNVTIYYMDGQSELKEKVGCKCEATRRVNEKQREINAKTFDAGSIINGGYQHKTFDDYRAETKDQQKALAMAKHYAENFDMHMANRQNVIMQGSYGTGKTHLAAAIRNELSRQHYKVLFMSLPDYIDKVKQEFGDHNQRHPIAKMAKDAELLILDDVGANRMTEFEVSELFRLVDSRTDKCTIYTTNYKPTEFLGKEAERKGLARIFSRMMQNTKVIVMNGPDYRMKGMI